MARKVDYSKLKKDELLKKVGSKLSKDELVQLAQGLQSGELNAAGILSGVQIAQASQAGAGAAEQGLSGVVGSGQ